MLKNVTFSLTASNTQACFFLLDLCGFENNSFSEEFILAEEKHSTAQVQ